MDKHQLYFPQKQATLECYFGESILACLWRKSIQDWLTIGCMGGGCGQCKVQIIEGDFSVGRMSKAVIGDEEISRKITLACKTYPQSDLTVLLINQETS